MDLVLLGGNVLTMDARNTRAEAVAVDNGHIAAVGATAEIAPCVGPEATVVQLVGRTLLPGFLDPHNHFSLTTFAPVSVNCSMPPQRHLTPILEAIATAAKAAPRGRWLRGWGFRPREVRDNRAMTRWALDEVAPENPVCIMDGSCHACYVNSAALALAGIDRHTPDPAHGRILREPNGEPNGTLWERAPVGSPVSWIPCTPCRCARTSTTTATRWPTSCRPTGGATSPVGSPVSGTPS